METPAANNLEITQRETSNLLLQRIDARDFRFLRPYLKRVPLCTEEKLAHAGEAIGSVCFPEGGIAGFLEVLEDGRQLAVGLMGREGFVGWPLLMGNDRWPHQVTVRARDATALRIEAGPLMAAVGASASLRDLLLRYASTFVAQMARTIVSNLIHPVERRTARWILLYHDRVEGDEILMTHEELGAMLGVRRASVTDALHTLEGEGAIRGLRGKVLVCRRDLLEAAAGETYGSAEAEYQRLIGAAIDQRAPTPADDIGNSRTG